MNVRDAASFRVTPSLHHLSPFPSPSTLSPVQPAVDSSEEVKALRAEVEAFAKTFAMPGFDAREIVHPESA